MVATMSRALDSTVDAIRTLIRDELQPAAQLPTEQDLMARTGVSRSTVREAVSRLEMAGVVEKRWGTGTFVSERPPRAASGLTSMRPGIPGLLATTGGVPSLHRFEARELAPDEARFPEFADRPTVDLLRVMALDGVPVVAVHDYLVRDIGLRPLDLDALRSVDVLVPDALQQAGIDLNEIGMNLAAASLDERGRELFDVAEPEPVIQTEGEGFDSSGRRVLSNRSIFRTDVVRLRVSVT